MDKKDDLLMLMMVSERLKLAHTAWVSGDIARQAQREVDQQATKRLKALYKEAKSLKVEHVALLMSTSDTTGHALCHAAKEKEADIMVIGRRGMSGVKRLIMGSTSKYCMEHAKCDVLVVKGQVDPEEVHDVTRDQARAAEELERHRRMKEDRSERQQEEDMARFRSELDRNVARMAEQAEKLRIQAAQEAAQAAEASERASAHEASVAAEEAERLRRLQEESPHPVPWWPTPATEDVHVIHTPPLPQKE